MNSTSTCSSAALTALCSWASANTRELVCLQQRTPPPPSIIWLSLALHPECPLALAARKAAVLWWEAFRSADKYVRYDLVGAVLQLEPHARTSSVFHPLTQLSSCQNNRNVKQIAKRVLWSGTIIDKVVSVEIRRLFLELLSKTSKQLSEIESPLWT